MIEINGQFLRSLMKFLICKIETCLGHSSFNKKVKTNDTILVEISLTYTDTQSL